MDAPTTPREPLTAEFRLRALRRLALAAVHPGGPTLYADLMAELCAGLEVPVAFVTVHADDDGSVARTLAARLDGRDLASFDYPLEGSPCAQVRGRAFRYVAAGVAGEFAPGTIFGAKGMDSYAAVPLADSGGAPLGMVVVMDRRPVAGGDAEHAEAMLKIVAGRLAAEIERARTDDVFRSTALAVSAAGSETVFDELVRLLAGLLRVETVFIARHRPEDADALTILAMVQDGHLVRHERYALAGTPCETVLGQTFRAYPQGLQQRFPDDADARTQCLEGYAGYPLLGLDGRPLGIVAVASRRPLAQVERIESTLKIFALRAAAELERLAASEALQRSAASYRAIFDGSVDPMVLWNARLEVVDINSAFVRTTGLQRDDVVGRPWSERPDADDIERLLPLIRDALAGRERQVVERVSRADGSRFDIELRYLPVHFGGEAHALGVGRDVTDRLEHERQLQRSEARLRATVEAAFDCVIGMDGEGRIVAFNRAAERVFGHRRDDVLGRSLADTILPQRHREAHARGVRHFHASGHAPMVGRLVETTALTADGREIPVELAISVADVPEGSLFVGHLRDISDRHRADQALRASEQQYRAIFNASADALILWNSRFERVDVNEAYERVYGWSRDEVVGRGYDAPRADEDYVRPRRELVRRALAGEACSAELEALRKDGTRIVTEVHAIPFLHQGTPHVLAIARDITERRRAEQRREELERQLRQAQKMEAIGQLTGGIAHDFNNILTSVIGYLVMAEERAEAAADATLQRQLGQAHLAAQRARDLIAQMLAFARRQRGERKPLALAPLVRQTLQLLRSTLPSSVEIDATAVAPAGHGPTVAADAVQLEQLLFNLCINARDAMGGHGRITVRLRRRDAGPGGWHCASCRARVEAGAWVELAVADTGTGIAPDLLERIFDPFFSTKAPGQGSGMGLAMVHGIVHDHGGHLRVVTAPGEGAEFAVWLPSTGAMPDRADRAPAWPGPAKVLRGRVLVVEDDAMVGDFLAERLAGWGLDVRLQRDPVAAAAWLADGAHELDLLVTDHTMPQLTGLQLAQRAHAARPALPIVLVSANVQALDAAELAAAGVACALAKPIDERQLREALGTLLAGA